jgi:hypothetical protein
LFAKSPFRYEIAIELASLLPWVATTAYGPSRHFVAVQ